MDSEARIREEIETLKKTVTNTQELYRETCALLFFRHGITPTANKLYQLVRKGSMSAPAEALTRFWEALREKSRVRIEHPDLPDALRLAAGVLVERLWTEAQGAAQENFAAFRQDAQQAIDEATTARAAAEQASRATALELQQEQAARHEASRQVLALERRLAAEQAATLALREQLNAAEQGRQALETALADARKDFAAELEKLREAVQRSEMRHAESERRALLEIDRERMASLKAQKETQQLRLILQESTDRHRGEMAAALGVAGDLKQKIGALEAGQARWQAEAARQQQELDTCRSALNQHETRSALQDRELELRAARIAELESAMNTLQQRAANRPPALRHPRLRRGPVIDVAPAAGSAADPDAG
jgi:hypothetical protein